MPVEHHWDAYSRRDDADRPLLVPTSNLTLYWRGSMYDRAAALTETYRRMLDDVAPSLRFFETGAMAGGRTVRGDTLDMIPFWLRQKPRRDIYMLRLESGERKDEPSDQAIHFMANEEVADPMGAISIHLPTSAIAGDRAAFEQRVQHYVGKLDIESGHAGYALNWDPRGDSAYEASEELGEIARRAPCIELPEMGATVYALRKALSPAIKRVAWLTLTGHELSRRLGGAAGTTAALDESCHVAESAFGLTIRAGSECLLGDEPDRRLLRPYRAVGSLLAAYRAQHADPYFGSSPTGEDETERWLAAFDRM